MKKLLLTSFALISVFVSSQELDETYLNSLPEDVRADVIEKMNEQESVEKPVYRRASTSIDKDEMIIEDPDEVKVFGSDFFDTMQTSFMPINEPNLDSSYILDFGDVLQIQLIGQIDSIEEYSIQRDGSINIPDVGKVVLSGLSLDEASKYIKAKINNTYIGTNSFVTLKNIRDINVLIVGNAFNPGIYTINGNSNMLHALNIAGGINEYGSYRDIELVRDGEVIDTLDIYKVLISGTHNLLSGLRSGDSIIVNPIQNTVYVESGLQRVGIYELLDNETISDLIRYANGYSRFADKRNIQIKRAFEGDYSSFKINPEEISSFEVKNGDSLYVREFRVNSVLVEGEVKNPGNYKIPIGTKLSEIIHMAGGYTDSAYSFGGYLENIKALEINEDSKDKLYDAFINNLIKNSSSLSSQGEEVGLILEQIKEAEVTGRIIAEFDLDIIKNNPSADTTLEDGDRILIPSITQQVYIQGEVNNPGAIRYNPGKGIEYYIENSGGLLKTSDSNSIFIIHPNGETENLESNSRLSFVLADDKKQLLYPGSIIYIPQNSNFANSLETASIWAPIISSIALSLTSLSVLNNSN